MDVLSLMQASKELWWTAGAVTEKACSPRPVRRRGVADDLNVRTGTTSGPSCMLFGDSPTAIHLHIVDYALV